jgi:hypothetical protein
MPSPTAAIVDIFTQDNCTLQDAFQFGTPGDTSWSLTGMAFTMEVKASRDDITPLLELTSGGGQIIVDDVVQRVLHLNVPDTSIQASLPVATYVYDFIMYDTSVPPVRTVLMQGRLHVSKGVTED